MGSQPGITIEGFFIYPGLHEAARFEKQFDYLRKELEQRCNIFILFNIEENLRKEQFKLKSC